MNEVWSPCWAGHGQVERWERQYQGDATRCWMEVMKHWINVDGTQDYPVSWEGLRQLLNDVEYVKVAKDLKKALQHYELSPCSWVLNSHPAPAKPRYCISYTMHSCTLSSFLPQPHLIFLSTSTSFLPQLHFLLQPFLIHHHSYNS